MRIPGRVATIIIALLMLVVGALLSYGARVLETKTTLHTPITPITVIRTAIESLTISTTLIQTPTTTITRVITIPAEVYGFKIPFLDCNDFTVAKVYNSMFAYGIQF